MSESTRESIFKKSMNVSTGRLTTESILLNTGQNGRNKFDIPYLYLSAHQKIITNRCFINSKKSVEHAELALCRTSSKRWGLSRISP